MGAVVSKVYTTLRQRDPHNQTLAVSLLILLTSASQKMKNLRAYTMWNCLVRASEEARSRRRQQRWQRGCARESAT